MSQLVYLLLLISCINTLIAVCHFCFDSSLSFQRSSLTVKPRLGYNLNKDLAVALESIKVVTLEVSMVLLVPFGTVCGC